MSRLAPVLEEQAWHCANLGSGFMDRLLRGLARAWPPDSALARRMESWPDDDIGPKGASLPLRFAGGLHALVLSGRAPGLAALYPPAEVDADTLTRAALAAAEDHAAFMDRWMDSPPQTNEIRRSAAIIPVLRWMAERFGREIGLLELGASGGLNLWCDRFGLEVAGRVYGPDAPVLTLAPDWQGPPPASGTPSVVARRGCDLNPLDPGDRDDRLRLLAYLWPDQPERLARTRAAADIATAVVDRADAAGWLAAQLAARGPDRATLVYHTIAWQYFPAQTQSDATRALEEAGAQATEAAPLAWFGMENDGTGDGARLTLRVWPGGATHDVGRADFHGRWIRWSPPAT